MVKKLRVKGSVANNVLPHELTCAEAFLNIFSLC